MKLPEIEISVKLKGVKQSELKTIASSSDAAQVCREIFDKDKIEWVEEFVLICLNRANRVIGWHKVASGGITSVTADPRVIMTISLKMLATSIIVCHNHPSGSLKASRADEELTQKIKGACAFLDIKLIDHIILSPDEGYFSFADEGLI
jgi:DNA repair protein RadC